MKCTQLNRRQRISLALISAFLLLLAVHYRSQRRFSFHIAKTSHLPVSLQPPKTHPPLPLPLPRAPAPGPGPSTSDLDSQSLNDEPTIPHHTITRSLVIASILDENTAWASELSSTDPNLTTAIYIVDNPNPNNTTSKPPHLTVPANKGHEAMVYLTYIIDTYHALPDIVIFMHAHDTTWHNNDFLSSSGQTVQRLRSAKVLRDGYMNLRCHHEPGCPDHIHPTKPTTTATAATTAGEGETDETQSHDDALNIPESAVMGLAWTELFPTTPISRVLSQPCCGQFAVSGSRIRAMPRERYVQFREWLLKTTLDDRLSGRVWEYLWQYVFGGVEEYCPDEYSCYCEGYGVCFGGDEGRYRRYFELRQKSREIEREIERLRKEGSGGDVDAGRVKALEREKQGLMEEMEEIRATSGSR
ncbi:predicted protein [Histoplasma mississippiense (nom. inval.)]|nr:predicted protein [Histoplasma mississippiense (nom. inval.)]EDN02531.1 predicted protein [Histoplasma mississippiense (nom. inval.)]